MTWFDDQPATRQAQLNEHLDTLGKRSLDYADGDRAFGAWLAVADALCSRKYGVSIYDLADFAWRDAHDADDLTPLQALKGAIEADGLFA